MIRTQMEPNGEPPETPHSPQKWPLDDGTKIACDRGFGRRPVQPFAVLIEEFALSLRAP